MFGGGVAIISDLAIMATMLGALTFCIAYAWLTRGNWKQTIMGLHVMAFMFVILTVSILATLSIFFGTGWPGRDYIRAAAWGSIASMLWWRVALLFSAQRTPGRHEDHHHHH